MTTLTQAPPREWTQLAIDTALRNGSIEIKIDPVYHDVPEDRRAMHRVRLLAIETNRWIIERPFNLQGKASVQPGMKLVGTMGTAASRWSFCTEAISTGLYHLNSESKVPVLFLALPSHIQSAQRRAYYRVSMLGVSEARARIWPLADVASAQFAEMANSLLHKSDSAHMPGNTPQPEIGQGAEGWILDFSAGGLAVGVDQALKKQLGQSPTFWIEMTLPGLNWPVYASAHLRRISDESHEMARFAFEFTYAHNPNHEPFINDTLCRVAAAEQRRQIQRRRQTA